jgi:hypothetical protein
MKKCSLCILNMIILNINRLQDRYLFNYPIKIKRKLNIQKDEFKKVNKLLKK